LAAWLPWRGGRAVECGGLENRFGRFRPTRVQIPPPPPTEKPHCLCGFSATRSAITCDSDTTSARGGAPRIPCRGHESVGLIPTGGNDDSAHVRPLLSAAEQRRSAVGDAVGLDPRNLNEVDAGSEPAA